MLSFEKAKDIALTSFQYTLGAFYGSAAGLSLGVGLMYDGIVYPLLDEGQGVFDTVEGLAYVLTHECDIDVANDRPFNDYVLICPVIPFEDWAKEFVDAKSEDALFGFVPDLASDRIYRSFYLPPVGDRLAYGGILYLNQICSTHRICFSAAGAQPLCALSTYAQSIVDRKLQNHLFRPKADQLPRLK